MKNATIAILVLAVLSLSAVAWKQYQELITLRGATLAAEERADLKKRAWDAESKATKLEAALADAGKKNTDGDNPDAQQGGRMNRRGGPGGPGGPFGGMMANALNAMNSPELQKLMAQQQRGQLDNRFAQLFQQLKLPAEKLDQFKNLLVDRQTAQMDVMAAAMQQGLNPMQNQKEIRELLTTAQGEIDGKIKSLLGDDAFSQYENYQQTQPQRNTVNQLQQSLSYTDSPLTAAQSEQLVQILAANAPARGNGNGGGPVVATAVAIGGPGGGRGGDIMFAGGPGGGTQITDQAITQAQSILSTSQVQALQQLQQQQQAQQQLGRLMQEQMMNGMPGGGGAQGGGRGPGG